MRRSSLLSELECRNGACGRDEAFRPPISMGGRQREWRFHMWGDLPDAAHLATNTRPFHGRGVAKQ